MNGEHRREERREAREIVKGWTTWQRGHMVLENKET